MKKFVPFVILVAAWTFSACRGDGNGNSSASSTAPTGQTADGTAAAAPSIKFLALGNDGSTLFMKDVPVSGSGSITLNYSIVNGVLAVTVPQAASVPSKAASAAARPDCSCSDPSCGSPCSKPPTNAESLKGRNDKGQICVSGDPGCKLMDSAGKFAKPSDPNCVSGDPGCSVNSIIEMNKASSCVTGDPGCSAKKE